jgi:hypothetical protein
MIWDLFYWLSASRKFAESPTSGIFCKSYHCVLVEIFPTDCGGWLRPFDGFLVMYELYCFFYNRLYASLSFLTGRQVEMKYTTFNADGRFQGKTKRDATKICNNWLRIGVKLDESALALL